MSDHVETEIKFPLTNPDDTRRALLALGAERQGLAYEMNIRLDDDSGSLEARHMVLRIRTTKGDGGEKHILTVKHPETGDGALKSRREVELTVESADTMLAALNALGYTPYFRYEKRRETFRWRTVEAVIDEMPYGWFMEIEGDPETINALIAALNLDPASAIPCSYSRIFTNVVNALGLDLSDLTFEAFRGIPVDPTMYGC